MLCFRVLTAALCTAALVVAGCEPAEESATGGTVITADSDNGSGGGADSSSSTDSGGADAQADGGGVVSCSDDSSCADGAYCAKSTCSADASGVCQPRPEACDQVFLPVCGCDGKTYGNLCEAAASGTNVASEGECGTASGCTDDSGCDAGSYCAKASCDAAEGTCQPKDVACTAQEDPVCGCDGKTYSNACVAGSSGMNVDYEGTCSTDCPVLDCLPGALPKDTDGDGCDDTCECPDGSEPGDDGCANGSGEALCVSTGGTWDPTSCGDYTCGVQPACDAVIPGCDCGKGSNFVDGLGCAPDDSCGEKPCTGPTVSCPQGLFAVDTDGDNCEDACKCADGTDPSSDGKCEAEPTKSQLCEATGGTWDELACGDYQCGVANLCEAIIPGCDCGPKANFVEGKGCVEDLACSGGCDGACGDGAFCEAPTGQCDAAGLEGECVTIPGICTADYVPVCGCDGKTYSNDCVRQSAKVSKAYDGKCETPCPDILCAGETIPFDLDKNGCTETCLCPDQTEPNADGSCGNEPSKKQQLCEDTGGTWMPFSCGDYICGAVPTCKALIPGCDCGKGATFVDGVGCQEDNSCEQPSGCGGLLGLACDQGEFCEYGSGQCNIADNVGTCQPVTEFCTEEYNPVCGCDGKTYGNDCLRQQAQISKDYDGECGKPCPIAILCAPGFVPVDTDGDSCDDTCECPEGSELTAEGFCKPLPCGADNPCAEGLFCEAPEGLCATTDGGVCTPNPGDCDAVYKPVCGCDGVTYSNDCERQAAQVSKQYNGTCDEPCTIAIKCAAGTYPTDTDDDGCDDACKCFDGSDPLPDLTCPNDPNNQDLCTKTGGTWDESSCGDYFCGQQPACDAIIPGCDCGPYANFVAGEGCVNDLACGEPCSTAIKCPEGLVSADLDGDKCADACICPDGSEPAADGTCGATSTCGGFGGEGCSDGSFCEYPAGECLIADNIGQCVPVPAQCTQEFFPVCGCDGKTYGNDCTRRAAQVSKAYDGACEEPCPQILCLPGLFPTDTDGDKCPDICACEDGSAPDDSGSCTTSDKQQLCESTDGVWVENSCGDYTCGLPPLCLAIIPGCNCGPDANYVDGEGCVADSTCQGQFCGGFGGFACDDGQWCEPEPDTCNIADAGGTCADIPQICTDEVDPVCGCDGKTYSNDCERQIAQVGLSSAGACEAVCGPDPVCNGGQEPFDSTNDGCNDACGPANKVCYANSECGADEYCSRQTCDTSVGGECLPTPLFCNLLFAPVCGCDGQTYGNDCQAASAGQNVAYTGLCDGAPLPGE